MALGDVKYIVARGFDSHVGTHVPGELLPKDAGEWFNMNALIGMEWVYPYVSDTGYADLPPHVFSSVVTLQEARGLIKKGESPVELEWTEPQQVIDGRKEREAELASHEENAKVAHEAAVKLFSKREDGAVEFHMPPSKQDAKKLEAQSVSVDSDSDKYSDKIKAELEEEIEKRNNQKSRKEEDRIPVSGTKSELVQRLIEDDRSK